MLYIFFTIVFIAELIVLEKIISSLRKLNNAVCDINSKILEFQPKIKDDIKALRITISGVLGKLDCFVTFVAKKRTDCGKQISKNLLLKILGFILRIPAKRILTVLDIVLMIRKVWKRA
jgi:hypothetical protein